MDRQACCDKEALCLAWMMEVSEGVCVCVCVCVCGEQEGLVRNSRGLWHHLTGRSSGAQAPVTGLTL